MRWSLALACVLIACGPARGTSHDDGSRTLRYSILTSGRPSGEGSITIERGGTRRMHYTFNDRGRGPDITSESVYDPSGWLTGMRATGHAYEKQPVDERLDLDGDHLAWQSTSEMGNAARDAGFYVSLNDPFGTFAPMVRLMEISPGKKLALLPAGTAWIEDERAIDVPAGAGVRHLREIAISGFGFTPLLTWLDEDGEFYASVNPWFSIIRAGDEALAPKLIELDNAWLAERNARLAKTVAHHPPAAGLAIVHANVFDSEAKAIVADRTVIEVETFGVEDDTIERIRAAEGVTSVSVETREHAQVILVQSPAGTELTQQLVAMLGDATRSSSVPCQRSRCIALPADVLIAPQIAITEEPSDA